MDVYIYIYKVPHSGLLWFDSKSRRGGVAKAEKGQQSSAVVRMIAGVPRTSYDILILIRMIDTGQERNN